MFEYLKFYFHYRMDDYMKETAFTRRLVVFHETLAPVKGSSERLPVIAGLWHKAVADRKAVKVTGAILKLLSAPPAPVRHLLRTGSMARQLWRAEQVICLVPDPPQCCETH